MEIESKFNQLPQNIEAEQALLSAILFDPDILSEILGDADLNSDEFYNKAHGLIFSTMSNLFREGEPVEIISIYRALEDDGHAESIGGASYLAELDNAGFTSKNALFHAGIVKEAARRRAIIKAAKVAMQLAYDGGDAVDILSAAQEQFLSIDGEERGRGFLSYRELVPKVLKDIERRSEVKESVPGLPSGIDKLDVITGGFGPDELWIIGGRPGMGKTSLALQMVHHAAMVKQASAAIFSLEMSPESLIERSLANLTTMGSDRIKTGFIGSGDWPILHAGASALTNLDIWVERSRFISVADIIVKCRQLAASKQLDVLMIDYLQLLDSDGRSRDRNRNEEVAKMSRALKALAGVLQIPILALTQLNRECESRADKRPTLSDIRESGAVEQDADGVILIYRDEVYDEKTETPGIAELHVVKQRNGPLGVVKTGFEGKHTRFTNLNYNDFDGERF